MGGNGNEPETIDVLELMKDLDEDEDYVHSKQPSSAASFAKQATTSMKLPSASFTLEPSDVKDVPQWLSSFQNIHGVHGRLVTSPAEGSSRDVFIYGRPQSKRGSMDEAMAQTSDLMDVKLVVSTGQETLAEHLQRSLSFETSQRKEMQRIFGQKDALDAYPSKGLTLGFDTDASSFSSSRLPWEGESISSPSTPSFGAGSVSLQKWFRDDARRSKQRQEQRATLKVSRHEAQSKLPTHNQVMSPPLVPKVPVSTSKVTERSYNRRSYGGHDANLSAKRSHESHRVAGAYQMPSVGLSQTRQESQQGRHGLLRHSFTIGNRGKELSEAQNPPTNNRSSSLELEKVAGGPKVRIVLYSKTSMGDAHGFEESNAARAILISIVGAAFEEKSVSEYTEYEQELKSALNTQMAVVPTVCARGRYITGLDNIMQLYKKGVLRALLEESMQAQELIKLHAPCICRGGKFLICPVCKGKRKLAARTKEEDDDVLCRHCSGTGLIKCPNCLHS